MPLKADVPHGSADIFLDILALYCYGNELSPGGRNGVIILVNNGHSGLQLSHTEKNGARL